MITRFRPQPTQPEHGLTAPADWSLHLVKTVAYGLWQAILTAPTGEEFDGLWISAEGAYLRAAQRAGLTAGKETPSVVTA